MVWAGEKREVKVQGEKALSRWRSDQSSSIPIAHVGPCLVWGKRKQQAPQSDRRDCRWITLRCVRFSWTYLGSVIIAMRFPSSRRFFITCRSERQEQNKRPILSPTRQGFPGVSHLPLHSPSPHPSTSCSRTACSPRSASYPIL